MKSLLAQSGLNKYAFFLGIRVAITLVVPPVDIKVLADGQRKKKKNTLKDLFRCKKYLYLYNFARKKYRKKWKAAPLASRSRYVPATQAEEKKRVYNRTGIKAA